MWSIGTNLSFIHTNIFTYSNFTNTYANLHIYLYIYIFSYIYRAVAIDRPFHLLAIFIYRQSYNVSLSYHSSTNDRIQCGFQRSRISTYLLCFYIFISTEVKALRQLNRSVNVCVCVFFLLASTAIPASRQPTSQTHHRVELYQLFIFSPQFSSYHAWVFQRTQRTASSMCLLVRVAMFQSKKVKLLTAYIRCTYIYVCIQMDIYVTLYIHTYKSYAIWPLQPLYTAVRLLFGITLVKYFV